MNPVRSMQEFFASHKLVFSNELRWWAEKETIYPPLEVKLVNATGHTVAFGPRPRVEVKLSLADDYMEAVHKNDRMEDALLGTLKKPLENYSAIFDDLKLNLTNQTDTDVASGDFNGVSVTRTSFKSVPANALPMTCPLCGKWVTRKGVTARDSICSICRVKVEEWRSTKEAPGSMRSLFSNLHPGAGRAGLPQLAPGPGYQATGTTPWGSGNGERYDRGPRTIQRYLQPGEQVKSFSVTPLQPARSSTWQPQPSENGQPVMQTPMNTNQVMEQQLTSNAPQRTSVQYATGGQGSGNAKTAPPSARQPPPVILQAPSELLDSVTNSLERGRGPSPVKAPPTVSPIIVDVDSGQNIVPVTTERRGVPSTFEAMKKISRPSTQNTNFKGPQFASSPATKAMLTPVGQPARSSTYVAPPKAPGLPPVGPPPAGPRVPGPPPSGPPIGQAPPGAAKSGPKQPPPSGKKTTPPKAAQPPKKKTPKVPSEHYIYNNFTYPVFIECDAPQGKNGSIGLLTRPTHSLISDLRCIIAQQEQRQPRKE